jgi:hypothetical protein
MAAKERPPPRGNWGDGPENEHPTKTLDNEFKGNEAPSQDAPSLAVDLIAAIGRATVNWVRSRQIAFAKARRAHG